MVVSERLPIRVSQVRVLYFGLKPSEEEEGELIFVNPYHHNLGGRSDENELLSWRKSLRLVGI